MFCVASIEYGLITILPDDGGLVCECVKMAFGADRELMLRIVVVLWFL